MAFPPGVPGPKGPDNVHEPFTPYAQFAAQNPRSVVNYGIWLDNPDFPTHPQDINPCGLLIRLGECSELELGSDTSVQQRTVLVPAGTTASPNRTQIAPVNSTRRFLLVRNIGGFPIWFGDENVLPGDVPQTDGGTILLPLQWFAFTGAGERHQDEVWAIGYQGETLISILEY